MGSGPPLSRASLARSLPGLDLGRSAGTTPRVLRRARDTRSSRCLQALFEIRDDVFLVLDADREPHDIRAGPGLNFLLVAELAVGRRCRMDDQRTRVADIGEMREQFHVRYELDPGVISALEPEREHRAGAVRHVFLREIVVTVARQARIAHPDDLR